MAKGWFVTSALPKRVGGSHMHVFWILWALIPNLPEIDVARRASRRTLSGRAGGRPHATDLGDSLHTGRAAAGIHRRWPMYVCGPARLGRLTFQSIRVGFVEEPPSIAASSATMHLALKRLCLPFFACTGGHVSRRRTRKSWSAAQLQRYSSCPLSESFAPIKRHIARIAEQYTCATLMYVRRQR